MVAVAVPGPGGAEFLPADPVRGRGAVLDVEVIALVAGHHHGVRVGAGQLGADGGAVPGQPGPVDGAEHRQPGVERAAHPAPAGCGAAGGLVGDAQTAEGDLDPGLGVRLGDDRRNGRPARVLEHEVHEADAAGEAREEHLVVHAAEGVADQGALTVASGTEILIHEHGHAATLTAPESFWTPVQEIATVSRLSRARPTERRSPCTRSPRSSSA
ncbi:hypothetical protein M444_05615 [Streptomyces sp. Mg1]|nr:hypothetical protein M444_05615 [Streptomyces sp. Mg1]